MGASSCSKPFVVQELVIAAKELLVQRAKHYHDLKSWGATGASVGPKERDLSELPHLCDLTALNNTKADLHGGERAVYCSRTSFTYSLTGETPQELNKIF